MGCPTDTATATEELYLSVALAAQAAVPRLKPKGFCHNPDCEDDVAPDRLFCCVECRDDYDRMEAAARRIGRSFP